jgi:hypothetical protein
VRRENFPKSQFDLNGTYPGYDQDERGYSRRIKDKIGPMHSFLRCRAADLVGSIKLGSWEVTRIFSNLNNMGWLVIGFVRARKR